jgi:hypothetical protein
LVPVNDVDQIPVILSELKLELAVFVDDQLGSRVENARALVLVGIVQIEFTGGQVVGDGCGVRISLSEADPAVRGEANFASGVGGDQTNVSKVSSNRAGDGDAPNGGHLRQRIDQALVLALLKGINKECSVFLSGELVDGHLDAYVLTHLRASTHCGGVNRLDFPVLLGIDQGDHRQQQSSEQQTAVAESANCELGIRAVCHRIVLSPETGPTPEACENIRQVSNKIRLWGYDEFRIRRAAHAVYGPGNTGAHGILVASWPLGDDGNRSVRTADDRSIGYVKR